MCWPAPGKSRRECGDENRLVGPGGCLFGGLCRVRGCDLDKAASAPAVAGATLLQRPRVRVPSERRRRGPDGSGTDVRRGRHSPPGWTDAGRGGLSVGAAPDADGRSGTGRPPAAGGSVSGSG
ncbi:MAG: hypothetical protein F4176_05225 [Acidimicrobiia bacterium]|nr:hypothetical protein [Acidimicrobiia bacterium]